MLWLAMYGRVVDLSSNHFSGISTPNWDSMTSLAFLSVKNNQLNGTVPSRLGGATSLT